MIDEKSIIPKSADDSTYVQMFYKAYHKLLYREARKYLNSTEDIDDIVQDSVVNLLKIWTQSEVFPLIVRFPML